MCRKIMLDFFDHIISIFSNIIMGLIGIYTAYLTLFCKKIKLIGCNEIRFGIDEKEHLKFELEMYNPGLEPNCILGIYLIFAEKYFLEIELTDSPLIISSRSVKKIVSQDLWKPSHSFSDRAFVEKPLYLLVHTNRGWSVDSHHYLSWWQSVKTFFLKQRFKKKGVRDRLEPITYYLHDENSSTFNESKTSRFGTDRYIIEIHIDES